MQRNDQMQYSLVDHEGLPKPQRWLVMSCVLMGVLLSSLDSAIANIALPTIARDLATGDAAAVWVVNGYQLAVAVCLLPAAALGEILGHKSVYATGFGIFLIGSLGCALSPTLGFLVCARTLQGVGGACLAALGPALVSQIYPRRQMGSGFALIALTVAMAGALGPTVAALILSITSWPWLFLVNVPVCLLAAPLFIGVAPQSRPTARTFDLSGSVLNALSLGLLVIGVDLMEVNVKSAIWVLLVGFASLTLLVWHQKRRATPLLPLDLLRLPVVALSAATSVCSYTAQILVYVSLPFLLQTVLHRTAVETGLLVTPWPLLVAFAAPFAGKLSVRYSASVLGSVGLAVLTLGLLLLATLPSSPTNWQIGIRMAICGAGFGFFQTPNNTTLMTAGPAARSGAAGGVVALARTVGWCLGSALVAMIFQMGIPNKTMACIEVAAVFAAIGVLVSLARGFRKGQRSA